MMLEMGGMRDGIKRQITEPDATKHVTGHPRTNQVSRDLSKVARARFKYR